MGKCRVWGKGKGPTRPPHGFSEALGLMAEAGADAEENLNLDPVEGAHGQKAC